MNTAIRKQFTWGTILLQTIISLVMGFMMQGNLALATDPPPSPTPAASESFNVSAFLTAKGQEQKYFQSKNPIASFIIQIVNFLVLTIGSVCFVALVVGGFILMTSHGNENSLTKGKDIIKYALIGLVIVLTSYFITAFVQSLFYELPAK